MTIIIQSSGLVLDLSLDIKLSIETTSPIFGTAGSMSLPVSLPLTDNNRRALNFPDRLDIYDSTEQAIRAIPDTTVIVTQGSWQQIATLSVSSCSQTTIESTLYFNESNLWSRIEDMTLPQALAGLHYGNIPPSAGDIASYRQQLYQALNTDLASYPDIIDPREEDGSYGECTYEEWETMYEQRKTWFKTREFVIAPVYTEDGWLNSMISTLVPYLRQTTDYLYITAFLRLDYVLHRIFEQAGYSLTIDFDTLPDNEVSTFFEAQWHSICVLNNTMDALYPGCLYYSALVPDIPVKEFLQAVQAQFGCAFVYQPGNTYKLVFYQTVLSNYSGRLLESYGNLQIAFNSHPDYVPSDCMESISALTVQRIKMPTLSESNDWYSGHDSREAYPKINAVTLEGVCQRTTTTVTDGEDDTKEKKCPLAFVNMDMTILYHTYYDQQEHPHEETGFYACLRNPYFEYYDDEYAQGHFDQREMQQLRYFGTEEGSLFQFLNNAYNIIAEHCDLVTVTTMLTTTELANFDFTKPYIIQGRLCWPAKLQFELENSDEQHVTIEFIAGRKL